MRPLLSELVKSRYWPSLIHTGPSVPAGSLDTMSSVALEEMIASSAGSSLMTEEDAPGVCAPTMASATLVMRMPNSGPKPDLEVILLNLLLRVAMSVPRLWDNETSIAAERYLSRSHPAIPKLG